MIRSLSTIVLFVFGTWSHIHADSDDWRITAQQPAMSAADMQAIGSAVCGDGGFEKRAGGLICSTCPAFTGNAGADSGFEVGPPIRGRFTGAGSGEEWIVDTAGCEAHFAGFGGAILLAKAQPAPLPGSAAAVPGSKPIAKHPDQPLSLIYYKPGFRLNDCLVFNGRGPRSLLVCSEADMAQGEVIGHISAMEISKREITRWRLLRWYDNSAAHTNEIISVIPTEMRQGRLADGRQGLYITMTVLETTRSSMEKASAPPEKAVTLKYQLKNRRLFATPETQQLLGEINLLTGKMLD
ncbi:MAG: hypothetical protein KDI74_00495 [Gammaproteobacteria bacterium]|nr:hypothetical protein [Gammaproteobacteria bacterium]